MERRTKKITHWLAQTFKLDHLAIDDSFLSFCACLTGLFSDTCATFSLVAASLYRYHKIEFSMKRILKRYSHFDSYWVCTMNAYFKWMHTCKQTQTLTPHPKVWFSKTKSFGCEREKDRSNETITLWAVRKIKEWEHQTRRNKPFNPPILLLLLLLWLLLLPHLVFHASIHYIIICMQCISIYDCCKYTNTLLWQ